MIFFQYLQQLLTTEYTLIIAAYLVYPASMASAGASVLFHLTAARSYHRISRTLSISIASAPLLVYFFLLLVKGNTLLFQGVKTEELWKKSLKKLWWRIGL
ncbi:hypothetical protein [Paenibacillus sp. LHD-38]|uniref:hypothetical protein n=1 Tax=Paenibacillus sp. LHD-38 TaxID=3072143 RepID=UPI00280D8CF3|nr:hypothetical protein [Paenibacillus sp. LHD-38]MDQ8734334.1 hypothetical protein [Paenibacillus sp. LHD-38]